MKKIFIITIILLIFIPNFCNGSETDSQDVLNSQQEELNISKFIKKAQKYTEDTFEDINVDKLFKKTIEDEKERKKMKAALRDIEAFKKEFENEEELNPLFNHDKGETAEFLISFPEKANYDDKEPVKQSFLEITQKHVDSLDELTWGNFEHRAFTGGTVGFGINPHTMERINFDDERDKITKLSRKDFVASNLTDSFEDDFYVNPLFNKAEQIGEIDGYSVFFNPRGFYFYWNKETEYLLESWLTFPAYPYGW